MATDSALLGLAPAHAGALVCCAAHAAIIPELAIWNSAHASMTSSPKTLQAGRDDGAPTVPSLRTRGFAGHPVLSIAAVCAVGLLAVSVAAMVGIHPLISIPLHVAVIVAALAWLAGDARVRLTDEGIERTVTPLMAKFFAVPDRHQRLGFDDIRAYRRDSDRSRFRGEVAFLTLSLRRPPYRVTIHDMSGKAEFEAFADAFEVLAARHNIQRRSGFYQSVLARVLTLAFAAIAVALGVLAMNGSLSPQNLFRLWAIIVPGTMYIAYRVVTAGPRQG